MIYIFFAPGFEEIEAIATLDILRRAELEVQSVGVGGKTVKGSHGITVFCDVADTEISLADLGMIVLPGGMPGTLNLEKSPVVQTALEHAAEKNLWVGAICAAPSILGHMGMLENKRFTCFPGFEQEVENAQYTAERVVRDGKIITAKGPGCSIAFALEIVAALAGNEKAALLQSSLQ